MLKLFVLNLITEQITSTPQAKIDNKLNYMEVLTYIKVIVTTLVALCSAGTAIYAYLKRSKMKKLLHPHFECIDIKKARKYFISTRFQNQSPSRAQEPLNAPPIATADLIKDLLKNVFRDEREDKFFLILADTGMGKTTFMINLYIKYYSYFNFFKKYNMKLLRFSYNKISEDIQKIENKKNTILLLDAFDEYKELNNSSSISDEEHFIAVFNKLIESLEEFYLVLITSRTQYFPNEEHNPYELTIKNNNGYYVLKKLYISPFNTSEIKKYLNKKYGILRLWNSHKKSKAKKIMQNSKHLMVRPMLLSYVDYLLNINDIHNTYNIYTNMINSWIIRESKKRKHKNEETSFKDNLFKISRLLARELNKKYINNKELTLDKVEVINIATQNNIDLSSYEITGQSLLTKDAHNKWKFSHKSIYEYFIAHELIHDFSYFSIVNTNNLDFTKKLIDEYILTILPRIKINIANKYKKIFIANSKFMTDFVKTMNNNTTVYNLFEKTINKAVYTTIYNGGLPTRMCVIHDPETFIKEVMKILSIEKATPTH